MFISLLGVTFIVSVAVCFLVSLFFAKPIDGILRKLVSDDIAYAWVKYLRFAIYVVGVSGGVKIYQLEHFLQPPSANFSPPVLDTNRWILEIYRTVIESLQSIAWMLLVFFAVALIAYVIIHVKRDRKEPTEG